MALVGESRVELIGHQSFFFYTELSGNRRGHITLSYQWEICVRYKRQYTTSQCVKGGKATGLGMGKPFIPPISYSFEIPNSLPQFRVAQANHMWYHSAAKKEKTNNANTVKITN